MRLCDDCIKVLAAGLSDESVNTLRSSLDLFTSNKEITLRDLWEATKLGKYRMNKVINELEERFFLKANQEGRRVYLELTTTGKRFMEMDLENRLSTEADFKDISGECQEVAVKTIDEVDDINKEIIEDNNDDNNSNNNDNIEKLAEEPKEVEEVPESEPVVEKKDSIRKSAKDNKGDKKSKPIVWDF